MTGTLMLERDIDLPAADANWSELPWPEVPQRFADLRWAARFDAG